MRRRAPDAVPSAGRRGLLRWALVSGFAGVISGVASRRAAAEDEIPLLDEKDPTAKALAYVADAGKVDAGANPTYKPGQDCSNCSQYLGEPGEVKGACNLVLGQFVLAKAWCKAWEARPPAK